MATQPGTEVTTQPTNAIVAFRRELEQRAGEIKAALPQHITAEKFQRTVTTAVMQNPDLLKADRRSLLLACMKAAQDGLLPDGRESALVTFKTSVKEGGNWVSKQLVQYMPMVYGLRKKILQARNPEDGSPLVTGLHTGVVYQVEWEKGYFRYEPGSEPELQHRVMLDIKPEEATDDLIVAAYSIATMSNGDKNVEVMRRFEIDKVRQCSQTGALGRTVKFGADKGKEIPPKGPWVDWYAEMAKKTVVRRHSKTLPMSGDILIEHGTEAAEFDAASGATTLLASTDADAPQLIDDREDESLPPHDKETGELIEDGEAGGPEPEAKPRRGRPPKAQAEQPSDESATNQVQATTAQQTVARGGAAQTPAATAEPQPADVDEQTGLTRDPAEAKAEEIIAAMDKAEFALDVERVFDENNDHIESMDAEIHATVMRSYSNNLRRVGARAKEPAQ